MVPHETLYMKAEDVPEEESEDAPEAERLGRRRLHSSINSDNAVSINRLEEPYPTTCHNNGKLSKMTQKYLDPETRKIHNRHNFNGRILEMGKNPHLPLARIATQGR